MESLAADTIRTVFALNEIESRFKITDMNYLVLATDYDGTIAHEGTVHRTTIEALERFVGSGRKLILVTGRELTDLHAVFNRVDLFERIVAENGAVIYDPTTRKAKVIADKPTKQLLESLRDHGIEDFSLGRVIVGTHCDYEPEVKAAIFAANADADILLNKHSLMVLPKGVDKMTGLRFALSEIGIPFSSVIGLGDGENDVVFLKACSYSVAVANATEVVKKTATRVTNGAFGDGAVELVAQILIDEGLSNPLAA